MIDIDGQSVTLAAGDAVIIPAGAPRVVTADADAGLDAIVTGAANARASLMDGADQGVPPWIA